MLRRKGGELSALFLLRINYIFTVTLPNILPRYVHTAIILTKGYNKVNDMPTLREEAMLLPGRFPLNYSFLGSS